MVAFIARIAVVVMSLGSQVGFAVADSSPKRRSELQRGRPGRA
jgi:hypothetical protein